MSMSDIELKKLLRAFLEVVPELRSGGVTHIAVPGVVDAHLAAAEPAATPEAKAEPEPTSSDPLYDPDTYPGGKMPGRATRDRE